MVNAFIVNPFMVSLIKKKFMNSSQPKSSDLSSVFEELDAHKKDMQGLISHGFGKLPAARYLLFTIKNPLLVKQYLGSLINKHVKTAEKSEDNESSQDTKNAVQIAFTSSGLKALGLPEDAIKTFPREFLEGMSYSYDDPKNPGRKIMERSTLLGDVGVNDPSNWHWGNEENPVDCLLLLYAETNDKLNNLVDVFNPPESTGLALAHTAETNPLYSTKRPIKEHFGFRDGISQPIIKGFEKSEDIKEDKYLFNPGEFILGHRNQYQAYTATPYIQNFQGRHSLHSLIGSNGAKDLGKNGTYLVFRQMEQHVEKFWHYMYHNSKEMAPTDKDRAIKLAAKMVGRWPTGEPLVTTPDKPVVTTEPNKELNNEHNIEPNKESNKQRDKELEKKLNTELNYKLNKFDYSDLDKHGLRCPFGAHIRRTNPRDQVHAGRGEGLSFEMSNKHRMLRRGRIYGDPLDPEFNIENIIDMVSNKPLNTSNDQTVNDQPSDDVLTGVNSRKKIEIKRGINFICLVSDISRQFEFVQSVWTNTRTFGELTNEVDPIISPGYTNDPKTHADFTTPQQNIRNSYRAVPEFTNVAGGAYFFMPGVTTLKYLLDA